MSKCEECGATAEWEHDEGSVWILLCSTHRCSGCRLIGDDQ